MPIDLKWRHQKKFCYNELDKLRLLTEENLSTGIEIPPNKFVINTYRARSGSASRAGVYRLRLDVHVQELHGKRLIAFAEIYGMPIRLGKYETGTDKADKEALLQAVMQIGSDAAGIISKSTEIEFVQAIKQDGEVFKSSNPIL